MNTDGFYARLYWKSRVSLSAFVWLANIYLITRVVVIQHDLLKNHVRQALHSINQKEAIIYPFYTVIG